jgi:hypothetical protein
MPRLAVLICALFLAGSAVVAQQAANPPPGRVLLLGLFHFDNPGLDAVKFTPRDVTTPESQAYLIGLSERLARFAPTRVLLEYPDESDAVINGRYAEYLAGNPELRRNEIYQLGFRVAKLAKLPRVHGFDTRAPAREIKLWSHLAQDAEAGRKLETLIATESARLQELHQRSLRDILAQSNSPAEDLRNKGFYMTLNPVAAGERLFYGADASADWWHRNFRMYAIVQSHAAPGERVLVIAGSGHTAILRDLLRADGERAEEDLAPYL